MKNRASIAASILQSPEMLKEAYAEATDAEGSAAIENEKYMNSVEGHLIKLKNAWEELWANVSTREFVNGVIDLGTGLLEIVNHLGIIKSTLVALGALDIVKWMFMGSGGKKSSLFGGLVNSLLQFNTKGGIKGLLSGGLEGATETTIKGAGEATSTEVLEAALSEAAGNSVVEGAKEGIFKGLASSGIGKIVGNIGSSITSLLPIVGYLAAIAGAIGIGYAIFKGISNAMDKANFSLKETREEAKALVSDYQTSQKNSNANKVKADELSDRYVELSKGVNLSNNQNLTLTNEEYTEYLSICNDIANMYPRLVSGYDAQGNAILKLKGNVEQLTEAYKQEQMIAARTLIQGGENGEDARSIWDDFQHYKTLERPIDDREKELLDSILSSPNAKGEVNRILGIPDYTINASYNQPTTEKEIQDAFAREKLIELGFSINMDDASFDETMNKLKTLTEETEMDAEIIYQQMKTMGQSFAVANEKYWDLDETQQGFITSAINGMDKETLLGLKSYEDYYSQISNLVESANNALLSNESITSFSKVDLSNLKGINTFNDVYNDILGLNSGKGNLADAKTMKGFKEKADIYRQIFIDQFKEEIGEDASIDLFNSIFDDQGRSDLTKGFSDILKQKWLLDPNSPEYQKYMEQFENYSYDEAKAYANAFSKIDTLSDTEIQQEFSKGLRDTAAGAYQATLNIEEETAAINSLNSAMASSNGATGMSAEEVTNVETLYKDLAGYDASELFESTANGIHLNQKELRRLNKEYQKSKVKQQSKQYDELQKQLSESEKALYDLQQQYKQDPSRDSLIDEINAENRRKEGIEENINALEREMAQYSALTSAYNQYVNAQSSANENAKYENIQTGYDTAKDLIKRGWGGQDDVRAYVNMFTQEDMMTAPVDEVIAKFNELNKIIPNTSYSMKDFFTVDENGKSTSTGVFNFLDVVKDKFKATAKTMEDYENFSDEEINAIADKLVTITDDGRYSFDFDILGGDQKVADMLGVDISLLQAIIQAAQDAGFEVQMSNALPGIDATTQHISEMRQELIDLGVEADKIKEYNFAPEIEKIELDTKLNDDKKIEQYTELAKKIQEAKEAMKLDESLSPEQQAAGLEYLNAQLDSTIQKATQIKMQATFGNLDISSWQADYQVLGTLMQDYYEKSSEIAIRTEAGLDCSDATKSCDEAKDALVEYLAEVYNAEQLREMGFDLELGFDDLGVEEKIAELKKQLEQNGFKLEIDPTFTDPTGDPTKGLDNQHIVIEVQFTTNGETVAIEEVRSFEKEADEAARPREATLTTNAKVATEEVQETNKELDKTDSKNPDVTIKTNAPKVSGDVSGLNRNLNNTAGTRIANVVVNGLKNAITNTRSLLNNFTSLANKTFTTTHVTKYIKTYENKNKNVDRDRFNGTAHAQGTISKFAQRNAYVNGTYSGDWGVPQDEDALVNELGEEIIIHDGKWRIANNGNMGFTHLRKGDVVLNHKQTEELLKNGYVSNSRAKLIGGMSHVDGTIGDALSKGSTKTNGVKRPTPKKTNSGKTNSNNGKKSGGGNNNSNKKSNNNNNNNNTAETFDWVEVKIQRIEEAIAQLDSIIDSVYNTWDTRNNNLNKDLVKVGEEIDLQKRATETYKNYLDKIGLSQTYINKIKKGELRIEDIKDDKLKEKIQKYQEYYNKVVQCQTSITELKEREKELVAQRFDNYQTWYEERLQDLDFRIEMMETLSDQAEKSGRLMSGYYAGIMRDTEEARIKVLRREYNQLVLELEQATNSNTIAKWSEQWYEMCASIDEVSQAIAEAENNIIEYQNTIREYEWERFDKTLDRIGQIADETEWLNELLEESKSFEEETGRYTESGSARMGLLAIQYDTYLNESARYAAELKNIEKDIAKDPYNQDLLDRRNELLEAQRDAISNALKERDAIKSLVEEGIEAQLSALQKLIDKYKEALQSQKDLYDYQNNVTESADEISRLQKLISAYQGDDSEESRLKVQQYQKELKDAQKSLYDTQYDRNISDTEEALDKLYEQYEETLNNALDDVDKLIADVIKGVNSGSQNIVDTIKKAAKKYGYILTDSMSTILANISAEIGKNEKGDSINGNLVSGKVKTDISSDGSNASKAGVDTASNRISTNVNNAVSKNFNEAKEKFDNGTATSIIKKNHLSADGKTYTYADGSKVEFKTAVKKNKDGSFVNDAQGNQYYFDEGANLVGVGGGLQTINGYKYYTDKKGALQTGWQQVGDKWYYFYKSTMKQYKDHYKGVAATGWQNIKDNSDGKTYIYYFDKNGVMQSNRWKDRTVGGKVYRYWLKKNGRAFQNGYFTSGKTTYYFNKDGYLLDKKGGKPKVFSKIQYKTGVYGITQDQLAWTQENKKEEAIIRPSDGAILTPLSHGDSVLNAKATKALFEFANNPDDYFKSYTDGSNYNDVPTINNTMNGDMNIQFNINGANITDYDTFKKQLTSDPQFERLLRSMTTDRLFGGSSLKKYKI